MKPTSPQTLIALVHTMPQLSPSVGYSDTPDITITIARLDPNTNTPKNWSLEYDEPKSSTGGCFCRMFASQYGQEPATVLFSHYGPGITYGQANDYAHAARAMKLITSRMDAMYASRGHNNNDAAVETGRWLEATGVKTIWLRPDSHNRSDGWLNKGEWIQLDIGQFLSLLRGKFPKVEAEVEAVDSTATA